MTPFRQCITILAAFFIHLLTHGILYSFGVIFIALEEKYGSNKADIAWIGSISTAMLYLIGPVAGYLTARFECRRVAVAGSFVGFIGYGVSIFVENLQLLYLAIGLISGSGLGLLFFPAIVAVTKAFRKYRAVAVGLSLCGAGTGAFVFSPFQKWLLDTYALNGTLLVNAAIVLNCLPFGLLLQQDTDKQVKKEDRKSAKAAVEKCDGDQLQLLNYKQVQLNSDQQLLKLHETCTTSYKEQPDRQNPERLQELQLLPDNRSFNCNSSLQNQKHQSGTSHTKLLAINDEQQSSKIVLIEEERRQVKKKSFKDSLKILGVPLFLLFACSQFFFFFGLYLPFMFIPDRAKNLGIPEETSVWIVSTIGISSIVSRILLGYIVDHILIDRGKFMGLTLLVGGLASAFMPFYVAEWMLFVYAVVYGICIGVTLSFISVVLADILGIDKINEAFGMNNLFCGVAVLIGPPFAGFLYDSSGNYDATFIATGSLQVLSCVPLFLALKMTRK